MLESWRPPPRGPPTSAHRCRWHLSGAFPGHDPVLRVFQTGPISDTLFSYSGGSSGQRAPARGAWEAVQATPAGEQVGEAGRQGLRPRMRRGQGARDRADEGSAESRSGEGPVGRVFFTRSSHFSWF